MNDGLSLIDRSSIFDLNPVASLIYDRAIDQILSVNQAFTRLSGFSKSQVINQPLSVVFKDVIDTNPIQSKSRMVTASLENGEELPLSLVIIGLDQINQKVALMLTSAASSLNIRQDLIEYETLYENITEVIKIGESPSMAAFINALTSLIVKITEAEDVGIYLIDESKSRLRSVEVSGQNTSHYLPGNILLSDLTIHAKPGLWKNSRKPASQLQTLSDKAGFKYLVTIPLTKNTEWLGLITVAGKETIPGDETIRSLSLLGLESSIVIDHFITLEDAKQKISKLKQVIQIEQSVIDNIEEGVILLTPDLKIAEMNPSAEIILGYTCKEVFRQPIDAVLIGTDTLTSTFNAARQGISTLVSSDLRLHNRTGKSFPAQVLSIPVKNNNLLISIIILLRDLSQTEQIRVQTQQLEQRAFLGEVSAVFAHEVKNPINSLVTGLQFIGMNLDEDSPHAELINRLQNDCQRLTHLMDSILVFSKPFEYHLMPVDLTLLLPRILDRWTPRMHRVNITSTIDYCHDHPQVNGDTRALEQVFNNLISNAVQAMDPKGGVLSIKVNEGIDPKYYDIVIADSGPGIPEDLRSHIFEPFFTTSPNGTGLGLPITQRIITAHKGSIRVESFPGGTMFHVLLPKHSGD